MRKAAAVSLVVLIACAVSFPVSAEEKKSGMMDEGMMEQSMMGEKGMMRHGKMMRMCSLRKMMMEKELVATEDGGVIVMAGNKLFKYDKDLNLIKEVTIKVDMEGMREEMKRMMEQCPMRKMMKQGIPPGDDMEESTE